MSSLVNLLDGHGLGIKSLVGLEAATNLQNVAMGSNEISDLTPLVHLPKLRYLYIKYNPLSDASIDEIRALERRGVVVSPSYSSPSGEVLIPDVALKTSIEVALGKEPRQPITQADMNTLTVLWGGSEIKSLIGLETATNLQTLDLPHNAISDLTPLASLVNLQTLYLSHNAISDLTPLASLVNLQTLYLSHNAISDVTPLAHLPHLRSLDLKGNPLLNDASINEHVPALQRRGVEVVLSPYERTFPDSPFDIELVFLDDFTEDEQKVWHRIARRWESVIQMDFPDYTFSDTWSMTCGDHSIRIPAGEQIDDLRIYVVKFDSFPDGRRGYGSPILHSSSMPIAGCVGIIAGLGDLHSLWNIGLHEIGHVLGIGTTWTNSGMLLRLNGDLHFAGSQAIAAFNRAGGTDYQGAKVPVTRDRFHWHRSVLRNELMSGGSPFRILSAITLGALSDLGYTVDFSMADPYELPPLGAAKPVADAVPFCSLEGLPAPVYVDD